MSRRNPLEWTAFVVLATLGAGHATAQQAPVTGAGEASAAPLELRLQPLWSVGGEDLLIGEVTGLDVADDGEIYFLDQQLGEVQVLSADGEWLRSLGREGEGPGEFREPMDLFLTGSDQVAVLQQQPAKIALLDRAGHALDDYPLRDATEGFRVLIRGRATESGIALVSMRFEPNEDGELGTTMTLSTIDATGRTIADLHQSSGGVDFATMTVHENDLDNFTRYWAVTTDNRIATVIEADRYEIAVQETDGTLAHTIQRDDQPRPRTDDEKQVVVDSFQMVVNGREVEVIPRETARLITAIHPRPNGSIWVQRQGPPDGVIEEGEPVVRLDEFDASGRYIREIRLVKNDQTAPSDFGQILVHGDRVYVTQGGGDESAEEIGEVTLDCYQLVERAGAGR